MITVVYGVAHVAAPFRVLQEVNVRVDVAAATATAHDYGALNYLETLEVLEWMNEYAERQATLVQDLLRLWNRCQCASHQTFFFENKIKLFSFIIIKIICLEFE
jgi:hypothetical protein